jgi:hypothetical protein
VGPATASASPVLTSEPNGTVVPVGTKIIATNTNNTIMTTSAGSIECTKAVLTGKVLVNSGSHIEGSLETASFKGTESEERCSGPLGAVRVTVKKLPYCLTAAAKPADVLTIKGTCGTANGLEFTLDSALAGECTYTKASMESTITTGTGLPVHVLEQEFVRSGGGFACPSSGKLDMTFDLYTDTGVHNNTTGIWVS